MFELIAFFVGAFIMTIEMAGMRVIAPFLGSSFIVWTSVIGIIMASLSFGYWFGGKLADRNPSTFKLSIIFFLSSIYLLLVATTQFSFLKLIVFGYKFNLYLLSVIVAIVLFAIPSILLGMSSPYLVKIAMKKRNILSENAGSIIGRFSAVSTLGSIVGTFLSGFYLIIYFGIDFIFYFIEISLLLISICMFFCEKEVKFFTSKKIIYLCAQFLVLLISIFLLFFFKYHKIKIFENCVYSKTTPYQTLFIHEDLKTKTTTMASSFFMNVSVYNKNFEKDKFVDPYHNLFLEVFKNKDKKNKILLLGNAGGVFLRGLSYNSLKNNFSVEAYDVVEIDNDITDIAYKYFDFPKQDNINFYYEDARVFLNREANLGNKKYDLIFFDIYNGPDFSIPSHLLTVESIKNIKSLISNDGVFVINVVASFKEEKIKYLTQIYSQFKAVFPNVTVFYDSTTLNWPLVNFVFLASDSNLEKFEQGLLDNSKIKVYSFQNLSKTQFTDLYSPFEKFFFN